MKFIYKMESVLIAISGVLCAILLFNLLYKLRSALLWRVNCWFCNNDFWMKFRERNSWTCPECEQYNGFTKDGDYNKPIITQITANDQGFKTPKVFQRNPPKNGLCKMCNINQQLKVTQLANFVPMNEYNFDEEIESYRMQLEKAYKLCSPCKKVIHIKLHKEKETLLGSKLLENRTPEKKNQKQEKQNLILKSCINNTSMFIAGILLILVSVECYKIITKHKNLYSTIINVKEILSGLVERIFSIIKMKTLMTFPYLENYLTDINNILYIDNLPLSFNLTHKTFTQANELMQKTLGGFVCLIQIIGHIWNINQLMYTIIIDLLWTVFVIMSIMDCFTAISPIIMSLIKFLCALALLLVYKNMKTKTGRTIKKVDITPKKMKNLSNGTMNSLIDEEDNTLDTDDDVSLTKFGLHNFTESPNETFNVNSSLINGRSFTPRSSDCIWTKPKLNSTFCVNSVLAKSPSSVSDNVFAKPSFSKYQKLVKDDSDSDLDESISTLCIGSPKKAKQKTNSIFSLRNFSAKQNFVAPTPMTRSRPLISPSKLGHSTSWVAGGYWGLEGERQVFTIDGSRSSSQSSGFESQGSSMNQRNIFSQPPSREDSVCGETDRTATTFDRFQNCSISNFGSYQTPQNFVRINSPVFPQMQYNSHVQIPHPRFINQTVFSQQKQFAPNSVFKTPCGSGIIKLPTVNSFTHH